MKKLILAIGLFALIGVFYACGGSDSSGQTGTVALYVTDDIGHYKKVTTTLNLLQLRHTVTNVSCDLLSGSETVDIVNLEEVLQLLDNSDCPAQSYNRVRVEFNRVVNLMDENGVTDDCEFDSYKDNGNLNQPNVLICDTNNTCRIDINGGINVIADTVNPFALDFDLKEFEVEDFGGANCTVTLKVEPQNNNDIDDKMLAGYKKGVTGYVSELDINTDSFVLTTKRGLIFRVNYSGALYNGDKQNDIDGLMQFAAAHGLRVRVFAANIDVSGETTINAMTVFVKLEGSISNLVNQTFTLTNSSKGIVVTVDYADAFANDNVEGIIGESVWVETKLFGRDNDIYLVHEVEVEEEDEADTDD